MPNEEHLKILKNGIQTWNEWREKNQVYPDLSGANLSGEDLRTVNFGDTNLRGAMIRNADLRKSSLWGADLRNADLLGANLTATSLSQADLTNCALGWTILGDIDLSHVKGLDSVKHEGPSTVGIDTIYRSHGMIPDVFLRGAGVGDEFLATIRSLAGAIQFYSCFISHSIVDLKFADRLYDDLQMRAVRCWYFPEDARWGESVWGEIDNSIKIYDKLV